MFSHYATAAHWEWYSLAVHDEKPFYYRGEFFFGAPLLFRVHVRPLISAWASYILLHDNKSKTLRCNSYSNCNLTPRKCMNFDRRKDSSFNLPFIVFIPCYCSSHQRFHWNNHLIFCVSFYSMTFCIDIWKSYFLLSLSQAKYTMTSI